MPEFGKCRMIGMGPDADGVYRIIYEFTVPPKILPDPLHEGQYLEKAYNQQLLYADGPCIMLKERRGDTAILDVAHDEWTTPATLVFGCTKEAVAEGLCPDPLTKTAKFSITNRTNRFLFGELREVLTATGVVQTKDHGDISASRVFVSGLGVFELSLPENLRIEQMTEEELAALDRHITDLRKAFGKMLR